MFAHRVQEQLWSQSQKEARSSYEGEKTLSKSKEKPAKKKKELLQLTHLLQLRYGPLLSVLLSMWKEALAEPMREAKRTL